MGAAAPRPAWPPPLPPRPLPPRRRRFFGAGSPSRALPAGAEASGDAGASVGDWDSARVSPTFGAGRLSPIWGRRTTASSSTSLGGRFSDARSGSSGLRSSSGVAPAPFAPAWSGADEADAAAAPPPPAPPPPPLRDRLRPPREPRRRRRDGSPVVLPAWPPVADDCGPEAPEAAVSADAGGASDGVGVGDDAAGAAGPALLIWVSSDIEKTFHDAHSSFVAGAVGAGVAAAASVHCARP